MKTMLAFLLFVSVASDEVTLQEVRTAFFAAKTSPGISTFYKKTNQCKDDDRSLVVAYKGAATAMYASLADGVISKLSYFRSGKALLEKAVAQDATDPEIRFLRFAIQAKSPGILGYYGDLNSDAELIIQYLAGHKDQLQTYLWKNATKFMLQSEELTEAQQKRLTNLKNT